MAYSKESGNRPIDALSITRVKEILPFYEYTYTSSPYLNFAVCGQSLKEVSVDLVAGRLEDPAVNEVQQEVA